MIDDEESLALFMIFYSQWMKGICALVHGVQLQFERTTLRSFSVRPHVNSRIGVSRRVFQNSLQAHTPQHKSRTPPMKNTNCGIGHSSSPFYTPPPTHQHSIPLIPPRITTQQNPSLLFIQMNILAIANKMLESNLVGSLGIHGIDRSQSAWGV